jgi:intracellular sulfur oxidation DsrE/DsrF family protein
MKNGIDCTRAGIGTALVYAVENFIPPYQPKQVKVVLHGRAVQCFNAVQVCDARMPVHFVWLITKKAVVTGERLHQLNLPT